MGTQSVNFIAFSLGSYSEPTKREFGVGATNLVTFRHIFRVTRASGNIFVGEKKRWPLRKPRSIQKYSFICFRIYILRDEWTGWTVTFVLVSSYAQSATLALFFSSVTSLLLLLLLATSTVSVLPVLGWNRPLFVNPQIVTQFYLVTHFFSLAPAFGLLDEIVLQRYLLCLCPARSCPAGSSAKSPHSVKTEVVFCHETLHGSGTTPFGATKFWSSPQSRWC